MPKLASADARAIARQYYELAVSLGAYRFTNWERLSRARRADLESLEWTLLTYSSDMTTRAIDLAVDDLDEALGSIKGAVKALQRAVKHAGDVRAAIDAAARAVSLGAAIATGNPVALAAALGAAKD
ncbi:MAG TPA: hypothetical protein VIQ60_05100 [Gemmatimonadaceae bacterium]